MYEGLQKMVGTIDRQHKKLLKVAMDDNTHLICVQYDIPEELLRDLSQPIEISFEMGPEKPK